MTTSPAAAGGTYHSSASADASGLRINGKLYVAEFMGHPIELTPTEYDLLEVLVASSERVVSRGELHTRIWPERATGARVVDTFVSRLRTKLRAAGHPGIQVVRRRGYRLVDSASGQARKTT